MNMEPEEFLSPPLLHSPLWSIIRSFSPRRKRRRRRFFIFFLLFLTLLSTLEFTYFVFHLFLLFFFSLYSFYETFLLFHSLFVLFRITFTIEALIIFGFKYQLGHAEFFSEAVYRTASWRKIDGTVNDIGPLCSNKSEERGGRERERERIALEDCTWQGIRKSCPVESDAYSARSSIGSNRSSLK